jgi:hypothetical protein
MMSAPLPVGKGVLPGRDFGKQKPPNKESFSCVYLKSTMVD